jgi:hypothetical protein
MAVIAGDIRAFAVTALSLRGRRITRGAQDK